jgi:uncharacterized membrane protein YphA (DoxX/SURF4 family)
MRNKIIYWVATLWLSLGMVATGLVQIQGKTDNVKFLNGLGYPPYFMSIIGVWKILGVIALLIPKFPLVKEWAYAGFFFLMTGAIASHIATHRPMSEIYPSLLLLTLTILSWYFRPASYKIRMS